MDPSPPEDETPFARFAALVRRELGAVDVRVSESSPGPTAPNVLSAGLLDGRQVVVSFPSALEDASLAARRLEILVRTFEQALLENPAEPPAHRGPIHSSLRSELRALRTRARARDALVLDAQSPVVWGSATQETPRSGLPLMDSPLDLVAPPIDEDPSRMTQDLSPPAPLASSEMLQDAGDDDEEMSPEISLRAINHVRALPEIRALRRGRPLHHMVREPDFGYVAHAFAGIYLLVVVFDAAFDELRLERAMAEALPRIESLVVALPPLDPSPYPTSNVVAFRRRR